MKIQVLILIDPRLRLQSLFISYVPRHARGIQ